MSSLFHTKDWHNQDGDGIGYVLLPCPPLCRWPSKAAYSPMCQATCVWARDPAGFRSPHQNTQVLWRSYACKSQHIIYFLADTKTHLPRTPSQSSLGTLASITTNYLSSIYYMSLNSGYGRQYSHIWFRSCMLLEKMQWQRWTNGINRCLPLAGGQYSGSQKIPQQCTN